LLAAIALHEATRREITPIAPYGTSGVARKPPDRATGHRSRPDECEHVCESLRVVSTQHGQARDLHIAGTSVAEPLWASRPAKLVYAEELDAGGDEVIYLIDTRTGRRRRLGLRYAAAGAALTASEDHTRVAALSTSATGCGSTSPTSPRTRSVTSRSPMHALRTGAVSGSRARLHDVRNGRCPLRLPDELSNVGTHERRWRIAAQR
jgi:hypothetical protein